MKLDIGGGAKRNDDWKTIDINPAADIVHDLDKFPWPLENESCDELYSNHTLEHLKEPLKAMEEAYRIAKDGTIFHIKIPWWKEDMFSSPEHRNYFKPLWFNKLNNYAYSQNMKHLCKINWKVIREGKIRGKHNKLKVYGYEVWLKADKQKEISNRQRG